MLLCINVRSVGIEGLKIIDDISQVFVFKFYLFKFYNYFQKSSWLTIPWRCQGKIPIQRETFKIWNLLLKYYISVRILSQCFSKLLPIGTLITQTICIRPIHNTEQTSGTVGQCYSRIIPWWLLSTVHSYSLHYTIYVPTSPTNMLFILCHKKAHSLFPMRQASYISVTGLQMLRKFG